MVATFDLRSNELKVREGSSPFLGTEHNLIKTFALEDVNIHPIKPNNNSR